jgi:exonuclease SbcD
MKIIHTSDWHLGRSLYKCSRYDEFAGFLDWLAAYIEENEVEALLVAGDIFDTTTPGNKAQSLYYRFLCRIAASGCRHVVITGGNHDSPSFLEAPKEILQALNIHVIGSAKDEAEQEVIELRNAANEIEAVVCAVPYLRDRDIRSALPGETIEEKEQKLLAGVRQHYTRVCEIAHEKRKTVGNVPIIAMGHLFTAGGKTIEGDGVRELYVGTLAHVGDDIFPEYVDYVALGHLHVAQRVAKSDHIRYCGSPIPMGFGEASQQKLVLQVEFNKRQPEITEITVPCFQRLEKVSGSLEHINDRIKELKEQGSNAWLEVEYTGAQLTGNLRDLLDEMTEGTELEIKRLKDRQLIDRVLQKSFAKETLDDLNVYEVFDQRLESSAIPYEQREELRFAYAEIIRSLEEEDSNAQ